MPYYNTAPPTPTSKNTINSIMATLPNIRDFLLLKNLTPTGEYLFKLGDSPSVKIGQPITDTMGGSGSVLVPNGLPLETEGILWKEENVLPNMFKNVDSTANYLKSIDYIPDVPFANGFGSTIQWPMGIQSYPKYVVDDVKKYGIFGKTVNAQFKKDNIIKNMYLDSAESKDVGDFITLIPVNVVEQVQSYIESYGEMKYGGLNLNGDNKKGVEASNIIGGAAGGGLGLKNGDGGLGFAKGGIIPNFDVRSSLAGRVLGAAGLINDTKLGMIGGQQLALALANNAAFNLQQEILGALNIQDNVLSLVKGQGTAGFPRPNYNITVPKSGLGKVADFTSKLLGFTIPRSYVTDEGSIFQSESGEATNIDRANELIMTTGKGQLKALIANVTMNTIGTSPDGYDNPKYTTFRSGYVAGYKNSNKAKNKDTLTANIYAFQDGNSMFNLFNRDDGVIPDLNYLREEKVTGLNGYNFQSPDEFRLETYDSESGNHIMTPTFSWSAIDGAKTNTVRDRGVFYPIDDAFNNKKNLLSKTQKLFNSKGMKNIVSRKGEMNKQTNQLQQSNGDGISKGNAVLSKKSFDEKTGRVIASFKEPEDAYCRAWTTYSRYDSIAGGSTGNRAGLVRNDGLYTKDSGKVPFRFNTENSVLEDTGFVHIAPYTNDFLNADVKRNVKNYMLSIENLAWHDRNSMLPKGELGPGDPLTGKKGRIMWFPPYDIQFSESVSVDWEAHKFIGRGENMYTYNNTERSGQLSFKIIVDHSTYTNTFGGIDGPDDHYVASFMAGCIEPDSIWTDKFTSKQITEIIPKIIKKPQEKVPPPEETPPGDIYVFFPNDQAVPSVFYESGVSGLTSESGPDFNQYIDYSVYNSPTYSGPHYGLGSYPSNFTYKTTCANNNGVHKEWPDRHNYGLNYSYSAGTGAAPKTTVGDTYFKGFFDGQCVGLITKYITEKCPHCVIEVTGFASPQGRAACNQQLADARANNIVNQLKNQWAISIGWTEQQAKDRIIKMPSAPISKSASKCKVCPSSVSEKQRAIDCPPDTLGCKMDRKVKIHFRYAPELALKDVSQPQECIETITNRVDTKITQQFYNETMFFDKLIKTDSFIFDKFRDKIRYFHPAFHSTTPEGLNSRLTFLHQCTRQGPTDTKNTNNLAFGRPPVCILRVGDFYNTKIIIDSLSLDYEPLVWDLNPEGIGVQPMIANVSLSFKFIGAESLQGPINKLQNSLSFNYYANTQVYEARADFISEQKPTIETPDTSTGLYLNNGVPSTKDDPKIVPFTTFISASTTCDENQVKANEKPASVQTTPEEKKTEPKITGIKVFGIGDALNLFGVGDPSVVQLPGVDATDRAVSITLESEGIQTMNDDGTFNKLITDDELKTIVSKVINIKIEMTPTPSSTSRVEEIVSFDDKTLGRNVWDLFGGTYFLGTKILPEEYPLVNTMPDEGNYSVTLTYDGKILQTIMAKASNTSSFDSRTPNG